jgi:hypothetical protein
MEAELLAGLAASDRSFGRSFHDDPDTRAALALIQRYRREAELSAKRARAELEALARARKAGLLPDGDEAAEADLDTALAEVSPSEPRIEKIEPVRRVRTGPEPANDAGAPGEPEPPKPDRDPEHLVGAMKAFAVSFPTSSRERFCRGLRPSERAVLVAGLARLAREAEAAGREPPPWLATAERDLAATAPQ